ncbi:hypothetical protein [Mucilaginibacter ginsenosidivorax]|uniref:Uncharacterized protein n=1 Tax=Mucilaginibacter ginsenosidivorax TaxID=862126 RepID=A0A5B8W7V5_9SPHI|nr:hypothetical protein [Mucilaginibacter ginsenosidivorax]QEC78318.1 hypothetical protein FSB76_21105 [Mucilaginibacter ginsenosidivorax]
MAQFVKIQLSVFCYNCIVCGSRPVIEQAKGSKFIVRCPKNSAHYQTQSGLVDIDDWNKNNWVQDSDDKLKVVAN